MGLLAFLGESSSFLLEPWSWVLVSAAGLLLVFIYFASHAIYNLYFHPLSKFPGPWYAAISNVFYVRTLMSGSGPKKLRAMHQKYGDVVRWAPDELSFATAAAWKDIYTQRKSGKTFVKDHKFYMTDDSLRAPHLINMQDPVKHAQAKKIFSHAFSPKALGEQEDVILQYADKLMEAISDESRKGPINLKDCYNWATFDILGALAFSESFGSVEARKTNSWVTTILNMVKFITYDAAIYRLSPALEKTIRKYLPKHVRDGMQNHVTKSKAKILARMDRKPERKDFCSYIFEIRDEMGLTIWDMTGYSNAVIIAGSETSATVLSALTHWLCKTPDVYEKLKEEVRLRFKSSSEITSQSATFPYLTAVINEILRVFPPLPNGPPRIAPEGGELVAGVYVPEGTTVGVHMWSVTHSSKYFHDPDSFKPERWLDPDCTDDLSASNPFLIGPRACIGQNMAWMELRILIAKLVFLFDFETVDKEIDWARDVPAMILWEKPDLMTKVFPREIS